MEEVLKIMKEEFRLAMALSGWWHVFVACSITGFAKGCSALHASSFATLMKCFLRCT